MCWTALGRLAALVAQPEAGVLGDVELAVGIGRQAVAAGLVVRAGAVDRARRSGRRGSRSSTAAARRSASCSASSSVAWSFQSKSFGQDAIFGGVVAHRVEQRVGHVGLEADGLRAADQLEELDHPPPGVHAAPADLAFGGEPLAVVLGDVGRPARKVSAIFFCVARGILRPVGRAGGGVDADDAVGADAELAELARRSRRPCAPASTNFLRSSSLAHRRAAAGRRPDRRDDRADDQLLRAELVGELLQVVVCRVDADVRDRRGRGRRRRTCTPSTSAAAVRSSIVSRSIGGSESGPLPTRPGHMALCTAGNLCCRIWAILAPAISSF